MIHEKSNVVQYVYFTRYGITIQSSDLRLKKNSEIEFHFHHLSLPSFVILNKSL